MAAYKPALNRSISLLQATAINMIDMVGIGPFVALPLVMQLMGRGTFIYAWILGAVIALIDGMVWAELGAAFPAAGGSYQFLKAAYGGKGKWGRLMPFLFVWQTLLQAPLVVASGAIGFAQYSTFLFPLGWLGKKILSGGVVILVTFLLYRKTGILGKLSVFLWAGVVITILWIISGGVFHGHAPVQHWVPTNQQTVLTAIFWAALGHATVKSIYCYLGYYNVCHLGGEIRAPGHNIPRSIFISITGVALLYTGMNLSIARIVPWNTATHSEFIVSTFIEQVYGKNAAEIATGLVLWIALASLFAIMLGYSRIPYAAAVDGNFFPAFARLHPRKDFPYVSLLALGGTALVFSLLFNLTEVISAILAMRILVQFIGQAVGLVRLRKKHAKAFFPFRMWLYPLPVIGSVAAWLYIYIFTGWKFALSGLLMIVLGVLVFLGLYKKNSCSLFQLPDGKDEKEVINS
ncbi:MAG TPA: APC family permease [Chitinophagaceae bacterium]|nr:APC family permease [Chitinophagaceae bacterium]